MKYYKFIPIKYVEKSYIVYANDLESAINLMKDLTRLSREEILTYYYSFNYDIVESVRR